MELLLVLSVVVIVLAVGVPSLRSFVLDNRRAATVNELNTALNFARSEALKRVQNVAVCRVANAQASPPVCDTGTGWSNGWVVYFDPDNNNAITDDSEVLRRYSAIPTDTVLTSNIASGQVQFNGLGASPGSVGSISFCDSRGLDHSRRIIISSQGRLRVDDAIASGCPASP